MHPESAVCAGSYKMTLELSRLVLAKMQLQVGRHLKRFCKLCDYFFRGEVQQISSAGIDPLQVIWANVLDCRVDIY